MGGESPVLKVFMDESGTHAGSEIVCVSTYIGRPKVWRDWTSRWAQALGSIKVCHAVDAQNLSGEFAGWTHEQVGRLAEKLLSIISEAEIGGQSIAIDLRVFDAAMKGRDDLREIFGTPYIACFQWAVQQLINLASDFDNHERIMFIHENNNFRSKAYQAFEWIKDHNNRGDNAISLKFGAKEEYPALQAADILAYETNKRLRNVSSPERRPWKALRANTFLANYGDKNMDYLVDTLDRLKNGQLDEISRGVGWNRAWGAR
jgi:hypothetical protein